MKLWLLLSRFECGGLERVQANLAPALILHGFDVSLVAGRYLEEAKNLLPDGVPALEIARRGKMAFVPNLLKQIRRHKPDIVMTTSNDVACLVLVLRAIFFRKMKVICAQHLSVSAPARKARGMRRVKYRLMLWMMARLWPKADAVIAVSSALAGDLRATLNLRSAIHTIYNPVVLPDFDDQVRNAIPWPWPDNAVPTVVFAGRLAKVKRLDVLLNAFLLVTQKHSARLLILGDGEDRGFVRDFVDKHGLSAVCQMVGHQDNPLPWIKRSDVLVLPSDYEGFGNVLVEAMACGTQIVATDCPHGPAEILGHGCYGQLVPTGDAKALADAVLRAFSRDFYVSDETLMQRANEFNLKRAVDAYLRVIQEVANKA